MHKGSCCIQDPHMFRYTENRLPFHFERMLVWCIKLHLLCSWKTKILHVYIAVFKFFPNIEVIIYYLQKDRSGCDHVFNNETGDRRYSISISLTFREAIRTVSMQFIYYTLLYYLSFQMKKKKFCQENRP